MYHLHTENYATCDQNRSYGMFAKQFKNKPVFYVEWFCGLHSSASSTANGPFHAQRNINDISKRSLTTSTNTAQCRLFLFELTNTSDATYLSKINLKFLQHL